MDADRTDELMKLATERTKSAGPAPSEWRYSLRALLVTTTILSIAMALGTIFIGLILVALVVLLLQVIPLLAADWLIRPANRRALAFVTAGSWILVGSGLLILAARMALAADVQGANRAVSWGGGLISLVFAAASYAFAWRRWRQLTARLSSEAKR